MLKEVVVHYDLEYVLNGQVVSSLELNNSGFQGIRVHHYKVDKAENVTVIHLLLVYDYLGLKGLGKGVKLRVQRVEL